METVYDRTDLIKLLREESKQKSPSIKLDEIRVGFLEDVGSDVQTFRYKDVNGEAFLISNGDKDRLAIDIINMTGKCYGVMYENEFQYIRREKKILIVYFIDEDIEDK